ncbi:MAG: hypothetical protein ACO1QS_16525 [Verrucomicrobiota bacterium]
MNLTDALTTLIDAARQLPENRKLNQAIKRVEAKVGTLREKKAMRDRSTVVFESLQSADDTLPKCPKGDGKHDWRLRHAEADYLACICSRCIKCMRLHPRANPIPKDDWSQS